MAHELPREPRVLRGLRSIGKHYGIGASTAGRWCRAGALPAVLANGMWTVIPALFPAHVAAQTAIGLWQPGRGARLDKAIAAVRAALGASECSLVAEGAPGEGGGVPSPADRAPHPPTSRKKRARPLLMDNGGSLDHLVKKGASG